MSLPFICVFVVPSPIKFPIGISILTLALYFFPEFNSIDISNDTLNCTSSFVKPILPSSVPSCIISSSSVL